MNKQLRTGLIIMISIVWLVNFAMPLFRRDYKPPPEINVAFMAVVGLLAGGYGRNGNGDSNGNGMSTQEWRSPPPGWVPPWEQPPTEPPEPPRRRPPAKRAPAKKTAKKAPAKRTQKRTR